MYWFHNWSTEAFLYLGLHGTYAAARLLFRKHAKKGSIPRSLPRFYGLQSEDRVVFSVPRRGVAASVVVESILATKKNLFDRKDP